jgi:hypothetical protein
MIYLSPFLHNLIDHPKYISFDNIDQIPYSDHIIAVAITWYNGLYNQQTQEIERLKDQCDYLHIYSNEPVTSIDGTYADFISRNDYKNITFYADAKINFELTNANFKPVINWFIDPVNYYATSNWGKKILSELSTEFDRPYMFESLLGAKKLHRDQLRFLYLNSKVKEQILFNYFGNTIKNGIWNGDISFNRTDQLIKIDNEEARVSAIIPVDIYNKSYYSIVCETTCDNSYNQYTEKVAKPIIGKRPFVVFSGQYYLENLRALGFMTFDGIIDESYDLIEDEFIRFNLAWKQVEYLCTLDPVDVYERLNHVLQHNYNHFFKTNWLKPLLDDLSIYEHRSGFERPVIPGL